MANTAEASVVVPLRLYKKMSEALKTSQPKNEAKPEERKTSPPPEDTTQIPMKLYKKVKFSNFKNLLREKKIPHFPNEDQLILQAIGTSRKKLPNQAAFIDLLCQNQMLFLITNDHLIQQYKPDWAKLFD